jgi:uncharacterized RDD family membrane protein YckC
MYPPSTQSSGRPPPQTPYDDPYRPPASQLVPEFYDASYADNASRGQRFTGALVDSLLQVAAMIPGIVVLLVLGDGDDEALLGTAVMLVGALAISAYQWYLVATTGRSLAKRWFGMKIVRMDGSEAGFLHGVVLRSWVLGAIAMVFSFVGTIDALFIFGAEHRCLHDYIAGTRVITSQ